MIDKVSYRLIYIKLPLATNTKVADSKRVSEVSMSHSSAPERATGLSLQIGDRKILRSGNNAVNDCQPQPVDFRSLSAAGVLRMMLFSAVAVNLPKVGFNFTTDSYLC